MNQSGRFDKFTEHARLSLRLAQEEAQQRKHTYIGTEHMLLGIIGTDACMGVRVIHQVGIDPQRLRLAIESLMAYGDAPGAGQVGLTPRAKKTIELAVVEARRMKHHYLGTEHMLLGIISDGGGLAAGILLSVGMTLEKARTTIHALVANPSAAPTQPAPGAESDASAFGPSEISQKTPEQMRATVQHLLTAAPPAKIRQIIQTTRQYIDMLEMLLAEQEAAKGEKGDDA